MRWNIALLVVMAFALCACGGHGRKSSLNAATPPVIQDLPAKAATSAPPPAQTEELRLVLPLPKDTGSNAIANELAAYKAMLVGIMQTEPDVRLRITAHSALLYSAQESMARSVRIANAVKSYLLDKTRIAPGRIILVARGAQEPLYANSSSYGRAKNNRMELTLKNISKTGRVVPKPSSSKNAEAGAPGSACRPYVSEIPAASPKALAQTYTFRFPTGRSGLNAARLRQVRKLAAFLKANPGVKAVISGHTDNVGSRESNQRLSYQRGLELQIALLTRFGIPADRTKVKGYGEDRPIADNRTAQGRSLNRRVAISMLPYTPVVRYAEIASQTVVPGESAASVTRPNASLLSSSARSHVSAAPNYRQRLERLARLYGAREVVYSGGVKYVPLRSAGSNKNYRIEISVSKCTLWLYRVLPDGSKILVRPYRVATSKKGVPHPQGNGYVTAIDYDPWWFPTPRMVRQAAAKGRRLAPVPPGSRSNPMGAFKIYLSHGNNGGSFRIHGTNKPSLIGRRVSQGCIRMTNKDGLELARTIRPGTEVVVYE